MSLEIVELWITAGKLTGIRRSPFNLDDLEDYLCMADSNYVVVVHDKQSGKVIEVSDIHRSAIHFKDWCCHINLESLG